MSEFEIRQAEDHDRERLIALVSEMWLSDITPRYQRHYLSNPHGRALTWLAFERDSGEAVGCTSIFPRKVIVDGRERMGAIGGDCYIVPRARRRGLATALHIASFEGMRRQGIDFMYGPPNPNNLGALLKAGSRLVTQFRRRVRPLTGSAVYRAAFGSRPSGLPARLANLPIRVLNRLTRADASGLRLEPVTAFDDSFDDLMARASQQRKIVCVRDSRYLTWRYLEAPEGRQMPFALRCGGELAGLLVLEIEGEQAAIVDLMVPADPHILDAALQLALDHAAAAGCSILEVSCTPESVLGPRLKRAGFLARAERGFQVAAADDDPQSQTLFDPHAWHFMAADQDMDIFFSTQPE